MEETVKKEETVKTEEHPIEDTAKKGEPTKTENTENTENTVYKELYGETKTALEKLRAELEETKKLNLKMAIQHSAPTDTFETCLQDLIKAN